VKIANGEFLGFPFGSIPYNFHFLFTGAHLIEYLTLEREVTGSNTRSVNIFSFNLNEEMN